MATLRLSLLDVEENPLADTVDISLKHTILSDTRVIKNQSGNRRISIPNLDASQGGVYRLQVFPMRHHAVGQFVKVLDGSTVDAELVFPVKADRVTGIQAPDFAHLGNDLQNVLQASGTVEGLPGVLGQQLWDALDAPRKAGLLNISSKMNHTVFGSGNDVFSFLTSFTRFRGDRFFAIVKKELRDETKNSQAAGLFHEVPGGLHVPPPGFELVDSYKTVDLYGNLQLTFFANPSTLQFLVDADIDDAQGIEHIFQVIDHLITGGDTNPYDIHEILRYFQKIDPHYELIV